MQRFESWEDVEAHYGSLTLAEERLKVAVAAGEPCILGDGKLPEEPNWIDPAPERHIRAETLRFLLTRKAKHEAVTEFGVCIKGAYVKEELNVADCKVYYNFSLENCRFNSLLFANYATFNKQMLLLNCLLASFEGAGIQVEGQLNFSGTTFSTQTSNAINLQGAQIKDAVFLKSIKTSARISLHSTKIGKELNFENSVFSRGQNASLVLQGAKVEGAIFFYKSRISYSHKHEIVARLFPRN